MHRELAGLRRRGWALLLLASCASRMPPPATPEPAGGSPKSGAPTKANEPGHPLAEPLAPESTAGEGGMETSATINAQLDRARAELEAAGADCAAACRALASMQRATERLCALADDANDRHRCEDAKARLVAARDRVRNSCGVCPGGPSLDRNAPVVP